MFLMYKIKQLAEDFSVKELMKLNLDQGNYAYFLLRKKDLTTLNALSLIAKKAKIDLKNIGYAGNKDKKALTEQHISIRNGNRNLENLKINNLELKFIGYGAKRIKLGNNLGNEFIIVIRNLNKKYNKINFIINYFDEQRFGKSNIKIGKYLLRSKFKEVCELLYLDYRNPLESLKRFNKRELRFYLHSYQSYIFNKAVSEYLKSKYKNYKRVKYSLGEFVFVSKKEKLKFPLINFDVKFNKKENVFLKILKEEGIILDQFLIRKLPWLIDETRYRDVFVDVKNFKTLSYKKDELNTGKYKQVISFILPKGSYATILIKQMFK